MLIGKQVKVLNLFEVPRKELISTWIEQDIIVPDTKPDIIKIVNVSAYPYINDYQISDNKIIINGKLNYYIIYKTNETKMGTRGLFVSIPYVQTLTVKGINKDDKIDIKPIVKNIIYSLPNERKIATKTEIVFLVTIRKNIFVDLLERFDENTDIEVSKISNSFNNIIQNKSSIIASREDVIIPNNDFYEILNIKYDIINTEFKESYNKIMVKGDIKLEILYLVDNQDTEIKNMFLEIPFSGMIELDNISDLSKFEILYDVKELNLRPNIDGSTKTMSVDYQINVDVLMYEINNVEYIDDFYSQTKELEYANRTVEVLRNKDKINKTFEVKETINDILSEKYNILDSNVDLAYITIKQLDNNIYIEGNAKVMILIQDTSTLEVKNKVVDILINEKIESDSNNIDVKLKLEKISLNHMNNDIEIRLKILVDISNSDILRLNIISEVEEKNIMNNALNSINIYIVKEKDNLWSIAKKYKTSVDKILITNNIEDKNKIYVGQKILIIR
jgi:LysM repeat protein